MDDRRQRERRVGMADRTSRHEASGRLDLPAATTWISIPLGLEGRSPTRDRGTRHSTHGRTGLETRTSRSTRVSLVPVYSFQGRKEIARGRNGGTTRGPGSRSPGGRWQRLDPLGAAGRRGGPGRHHVHRERAVRQAAADVARLGRDRRPALQARPPSRDRRCRSSRSTTRSPRSSPSGPTSAASRKPRWTGVHPQACVAPTAQIGAGRGDLSVRLRRRRGRDRRRHDAPSRRRDRRRCKLGREVHHPPQRRALSPT